MALSHEGVGQVFEIASHLAQATAPQKPVLPLAAQKRLMPPCVTPIGFFQDRRRGSTCAVLRRVANEWRTSGGRLERARRSCCGREAGAHWCEPRERGQADRGGSGRTLFCIRCGARAEDARSSQLRISRVPRVRPRRPAFCCVGRLRRSAQWRSIRLGFVRAPFLSLRGEAQPPRCAYNWEHERNAADCRGVTPPRCAAATSQGRHRTYIARDELLDRRLRISATHRAPWPQLGRPPSSPPHLERSVTAACSSHYPLKQLICGNVRSPSTPASLLPPR